MINKKAIAKTIDLELKTCFQCDNPFILGALENVFESNDLYCNPCAEETRENYFSGE